MNEEMTRRLSLMLAEVGQDARSLVSSVQRIKQLIEEGEIQRAHGVCEETINTHWEFVAEETTTTHRDEDIG